MFFLKFSIIATFLLAISHRSLLIDCAVDPYEANVIFRVWRNYSNIVKFNSDFKTTLEAQGCPKTANFSIIIHGWLETVDSTWVNTLITNLLKYSNGCVMFVDYSFYAKNTDYFGMVRTDFAPIAKLVGRKLVQIGNYSRIFMFGFSFGGRLATEVGITTTNGAIGRIDLCEPAGPGFDGTANAKNFTLAAKIVTCISTSNDKGTTSYNLCPQSFRLGYCGWSQPAAGPYPMGSHGLCPHMYNSAFKYSFVPNGALKKYGCPYTKLANMTACPGARMGFFDSTAGTGCKGEYFIDTASAAPYYITPPAGLQWSN